MSSSSTGDTYRVRLRFGPLPGSDYINASFVNVRNIERVLSYTAWYLPHSVYQGYKQKGAYIAVQCPLESTVADFWKMINEFQCSCVIMLCQLKEDGEVSTLLSYSIHSVLLTMWGWLLNCRRVATVSGRRRKESHSCMVDSPSNWPQSRPTETLSLGSWRWWREQLDSIDLTWSTCFS